VWYHAKRTVKPEITHVAFVYQEVCPSIYHQLWRSYEEQTSFRREATCCMTMMQNLRNHLLVHIVPRGMRLMLCVVNHPSWRFSASSLVPFKSSTTSLDVFCVLDVYSWLLSYNLHLLLEQMMFSNVCMYPAVSWRMRNLPGFLPLFFHTGGRNNLGLKLGYATTCKPHNSGSMARAIIVQPCIVLLAYWLSHKYLRVKQKNWEQLIDT